MTTCPYPYSSLPYPMIGVLIQLVPSFLVLMTGPASMRTVSGFLVALVQVEADMMMMIAVMVESTDMTMMIWNSVLLIVVALLVLVEAGVLMQMVWSFLVMKQLMMAWLILSPPGKLLVSRLAPYDPQEKGKFNDSICRPIGGRRQRPGRLSDEGQQENGKETVAEEPREVPGKDL